MIGKSIDGPELVVAMRHGECDACSWQSWGLTFPTEADHAVLSQVTDLSRKPSARGFRQTELQGINHYKRYGAGHLVLQGPSYRSQALTAAQLKHYSQAELRRVEVVTLNSLAERSYGQAWGETREQVLKSDPGLLERWQKLGPFYFSFLGGNSLADVSEQMGSLIVIYFPRYAGKKIFLNCHGGNILALRFQLEGWLVSDILAAMHCALQQIMPCTAIAYRRDESGKLALVDKYVRLGE